MKTAGKPKKDGEWMALLDSEPDRAMEYLVGAYTGLIVSEASKYLKNEEDVKDCVSETFLEVYTHRHEYDQKKGTLAVWIGSIARHRAISAYRKSQNAAPAADNDMIDSVPDETDQIGEAEDAYDIARAIEMLDERDQELLRMKYYQGMSIAEIAESLHIPYETAKKRHTRSMKKLRKALLLILLIAALITLAACGIMKLLQYYGILPGYGVATESNPVCGLLAEEVTEDTDLYHAAVTDATFYNGELEVKYDFWVPEQDFEKIYSDEVSEEYGYAKCPLTVAADITWPDGTVLESPASSLGVADYFYGNGTVNAVLSEKEYSGLAEGGELNLVLVIRDIVFDGKNYTDPVSIPFALKRISVETLDNYPGEYDSEKGGLALDPKLEDGTLSLNVYTLAGTTWEYSKGLNRKFYYDELAGGYDETPVTIVDEDGNVYEGNTPVMHAASETVNGPNEEIPESHYTTEDFYRLGLGMTGYSTFLFEGIEPGKYTLKLPDIHILAFGDYGHLDWNLEDCTFSDKAISIPGGKMYTTSIKKLDAWGSDWDNFLDYVWEIRVRCELDRDDLTVTGLNYPFALNPLEHTLSWKLQNLLNQNPDNGFYNVTPGCLDEKTGELVYKVGCDEICWNSHDFSHIEYSPSRSDRISSPIDYRYNCPLELEFEVTEE